MTKPKQTFNKTATLHIDLLAKWEAQGLIVDPAKRRQAISYMKFVGGYRLKGFWHRLLDQSTKTFPHPTYFNDVVALYEFDCELRAITMAAVERLEIAVRVAIADYLSIKYSPHWFLDPSLFRTWKDYSYSDVLAKLEDEVGRASDKPFVSHYFAEYDNPRLPPSWSVSECVTFGFWSRLYQLLADDADRKAIAETFRISDTDVFGSWMHTLTYVRNLAAHNSQLVRIRLRLNPRVYKKKRIFFKNSRPFFSAATVISFLLRQTGLPHDWKGQLESLFSKYPQVNPSEIGFPEDWKNCNGWK